MSRIFLFLLVGCAAAVPPLKPMERVDWVAVDAAMREAAWRTDHCVEPNSPKCDALWLVKDDIQELLKFAKVKFEAEHERICAP